jgi:phosphoglycolate phosphatase-like HAD superfamily hydrolase
MNPLDQIKSFKPQKEFFVGIDSDGCVFDSMEIKQKECFCPQFINVYDLQRVSKYARECWEFVNLYSKDRGCNRFNAIVQALDLLASRPEVIQRGAKIASSKPIREWMKAATQVTNSTLKEEANRTGNPDLVRCLLWSEEVNAAVQKIVRDVPPYPQVSGCLNLMKEKSDLMVVSQTPTEALIREWGEHKIEGNVRMICGQEMGTKAQHLSIAAKPYYPDDKILLIGDAPADHKAAKANNACFYPINPGHEEGSWQRLQDEAIHRFYAGTYAGSYEEALVKEFHDHLPDNPPWKK